eukprot:CAMPEP_0119069578 /NCGR_PEP_ID=MMETSP1178-20130426/24317_1 /TAXON_ID=33656 /ORGANISM="unid sp, Strain CCMP2000" /LENGTH=163 /DNA_ID=CAMNT_0007051355 /DNA_START=79 /DNA_END=570 /DNA_ORIENTATION=-
MQVSKVPHDADWSWTQAEFLLSGHSMPRTPDGAPLAEHASFLPHDDTFILGVSPRPQRQRFGSNDAVSPPLAPLRAPPNTPDKVAIGAEWNTFGGGIPLVRQHSQELQCIVQDAFDEMEAALALGRTFQPCRNDHEQREPSVAAVPFACSMHGQLMEGCEVHR